MAYSRHLIRCLFWQTDKSNENSLYIIYTHAVNPEAFSLSRLLNICGFLSRVNERGLNFARGQRN